MPRRRTLAFFLLILALAVSVWVVTKGPPPPSPNPPGAFSFAVLGDAPYYHHEEMQYRVVLQDLDAHDLQFVIHVGDIWWRPCSDAMYQRARGWFRSQRHRVYYTPGDNEWADCWEPRVGGYDPHERLAHLRSIFYDEPVTRQRGYPENMRWRDRDMVFATLHLIGARNGRRSSADDAEVNARTDAAIAWLRETFKENATAIVLAMHANMFPDMEEYRAPYKRVLAALDEEVARFGKPVLLVHGENHDYVVDHPLPNRPNFTRMQVPGSPLVGWVRVEVRPNAPSPFTFEPRVVPRWKYW